MTKFILTKELGKLARWLRLLGYDASYYHQEDLGKLLITSLREKRLIITRCHKLKKSSPSGVVLIKSCFLKEQLRELKKMVNLSFDRDKVFTRCSLCNTLLIKIDKKEEKEKIPEYVYQTHNFFMKCPSCGRVYWEGSHWGNINKIKEVLT